VVIFIKKPKKTEEPKIIENKTVDSKGISDISGQDSKCQQKVLVASCRDKKVTRKKKIMK